MQTCEYGCRLEAVHQFKSSGKWCCSSNVNSCPGKRKTDSEKKKGINPWAGKDHPRGFKNKTPHNKGKTYQELYGDKAIAMKKAIGERSKGKNTWSNLSEEQKDRARQNLKKVRIGGYIRGSGYGKKGWYKGFWCDSSWELAFIIYHLEHEISIERNKKTYPYIYEGKTYSFLPDFIVNETLIEIKGVWNEKQKEKIKQCPVYIKVVDKREIQKYLNYTREKYGKDFTKLYQGK
jgi:hypothetical protein